VGGRTPGKYGDQPGIGSPVRGQQAMKFIADNGSRRRRSSSTEHAQMEPNGEITRIVNAQSQSFNLLNDGKMTRLVGRKRWRRTRRVYTLAEMLSICGTACSRGSTPAVR
jgi:hypothetical protein